MADRGHPTITTDESAMSTAALEHRNDSRTESHESNEADPIGLREKNDDQTSESKTAWKPSWHQVGPVLGLAGLILTILSIPAALGILRASDGDEVASWTYSPNVYLGILTALTSKATSLAALQGAVVAWWLRAMRGSTLQQLHHDWAMGQNIWDALIAGRRINMIGIACICATIAAIDAPLLQRASSVVSRSPNTNVTLQVNLVPQIPGYYSGQTGWDNQTGVVQIAGFDPNPDFYPVAISWFNNDTIPAVVSGCPGDCAVTLRGPMIGVWNCTSSTRYVNYTQVLAGNLTWAQQQSSPELMNRTAFRTGLTMESDTEGREFLWSVTGVSDQNATDTCGGNYNETWCMLASAVGEYDLIVRDNQTLFASGQAKPRFVAWSNNTAINSKTNEEYSLAIVPGIQMQANYNSTFSGVVFVGSARYSTRTTFLPIAWPYHPNIGDVSPWMHSHTVDYIDFNRGNACIPAWIDPFEDLMSGLNELAFRIGVHTARRDFRTELLSQKYTPLDPGVQIAYPAPGVLVSNVNVFKVDYLFFFGAALVQLVCVLVIMYTFYGWWRIGRAVSFSPLELARAFNAPMLDNLASNMKAEEMAERLGDHRMRYGAIGPILTQRGTVEAERMALEDRDVVHEPVKGMTFRH